MTFLLTDPLLLLLLVIPAWLTARLLRTLPTPLQAASETLLLTVSLVPIPVFLLAMLTRSYITVDWMVGGSAAITVLAGGALMSRAGSGWKAAFFAFRPMEPGDKAALLAGAAVFSIFLVNYDRRHFQYGCINGVVMQAITAEAAGAFDPHGNEDEDAVESTDWGQADARETHASMDLLDVHGTGQRLGTTAIIAPHVALFDVFGFRLIYALLPVMCLLFSIRLGRALIGRPGLALIAGLVMVLNPYVIKIVILDENVMAFCFTTAALALLVEEQKWQTIALAGWAFGAALGIRHIDLPFGLAAVILIGWRPRLLGAFAVVGFIAALPCALHHHFTYGSIFAHEHFVDEIFVSVPHQFLGMTFDYTGLLNWPFHSEVIRTPYNAFPTSIYYPLNTLAHFGTALCGVAVVGLLPLWTTRRRLLVALSAWLIPQYALLAVLENWMDPNKMGIIITLFPAMTVTLALGMGWLTSPRRWAAAAGATAALSLLSLGLGSVPFTDDPRFYEKYPRVRKELPEYYDFERSRVATGNPLPSLYFAQQYTLWRPGDRLAHLWEDLRDRRFRRPATSVSPASGKATITIDLSQPLMGRDQLAQKGAGSPLHVDATGDVAIELTNVRSWHTGTTGVRVARNGDSELDVFLRFGDDGFADVASDRLFTIEERARPGLRTQSGGGHSSLTLEVRPGDRVRILETVSLDEVLVYVWEVTIGDDGTPSTGSPRRLFHN